MLSTRLKLVQSTFDIFIMAKASNKLCTQKPDKHKPSSEYFRCTAVEACMSADNYIKPVTTAHETVSNYDDIEEQSIIKLYTGTKEYLSHKET